MRVRIEIQSDLQEDEVIIRCAAINEKILSIQNAVSSIEQDTRSIVLYRGETEYFVPLEQLLFFETDGKNVTAHTADKMYETPYRLYELTEMLPGSFMRIAKSTIANINQIYSVARNLTASSQVEFYGSIKKVYVSRRYYKELIERMAEKRRRI